MRWVAEVEGFVHVVSVTTREWEAFQVLKDGSWDAVLHPSVKGANPGVRHELRGPADKDACAGYDWVIGSPGLGPLRRGTAVVPGTKFKVTLFVGCDGTADRVSWELQPVDDEGDGSISRGLAVLDAVPVHTFSIAGTMTDWEPRLMQWDGECFSAVVRIGAGGYESFQCLQDGSWDTVVYPSVDGATPFTYHTMQGPDKHNQGKNWTLGAEGDKPGTKYKVNLFVDARGVAKRVSWDLYRSHDSSADGATIVAIAGLASSALEASSASTGDGFQPTWVNVQKLVVNPMEVFRTLSLRLTGGTLKDGTEVKCTTDAEGCEVRPINSIEGVKDLNPQGSVKVPVWAQLVEELEGDFNWHAFCYDWRKWGDRVYVESMLERFQGEVEAALAADGNSKASLVGHSMGASVILYLVSMLDETWVKDRISNIVLVAPAHTGSPSMVSSFSFCPFVDTQSWIPVPIRLHSTLGDLTSTWPCMVAEMPLPAVGGKLCYPEDYVFARTPDREYTIGQLGDFLNDLAACKPRREFGAALWPGIQELCRAVKTPMVPTTIIYGAGTPTPAEVEYTSSDLGLQPKLTRMEGGDGTITAASIERLAEAWKADGANVRLLPEPGKSDTVHKGLVGCPFTIGMLPKILEGKPLTPIAVTVKGARGLMNLDFGVANLSDPFCRFEIVGKPSTKRQTECINDTCDPDWNFTETIYAYTEGDNVRFTVFDLDVGMADGQLLGMATLSSEQLLAGFDGSLTFHSPERFPGELMVSVTLLDTM